MRQGRAACFRGIEFPADHNVAKALLLMLLLKMFLHNSACEFKFSLSLFFL